MHTKSNGGIGLGIWHEDTGHDIIPRDAVSDALVNTFIEDGSLPGLEAAIDEYGKLSEQEPSEEELAAAAAAQVATKP